MINLFKNTTFFACYIIFLVIGAIVLMSYSKTEIFLSINQMNHAYSDVFFRYYTNVGDGIFYAVVIIGLLFFKFRYAIIAGVCFLFSSLLAQFLKRVVFTEEFRPSKFLKDSGVDFHIVEGVKLYSNNSFPSGHATTAFSIFCLLALIIIDKRYGIVFFVLALFASYSRIYLGQHFFADIYAGSIIGVVTTIVIFYFLDNYFNKLNKSWPERNLLKR